MNQPQTAIIPDHCKAGIFIEANIHFDQFDVIKTACKHSLDALQKLQSQFNHSSLGLSIAFGSQAWHFLGHKDEGCEIKPFQALGNGLAPTTQHDLLIHIQSMQQDLCFALATQILTAFGNSIEIKTEIHGFRLLEERGTDGFVDGTENPQDDDIKRVAIIPDDKPDAGGSYVLLQRYQHDLKKWNSLPLEKQEASVARTKEENEELSKSARLPQSHLGRVDLKENGVGLKIVRRSLPYGTISGENGLMFIAYCNNLHNIEVQLLSMFGDRDGQTDLLLKHLSTAKSGAYYYAPSITRLQTL